MLTKYFNIRNEHNYIKKYSKEVEYKRNCEVDKVNNGYNDLLKNKHKYIYTSICNKISTTYNISYQNITKILPSNKRTQFQTIASFTFAYQSKRLLSQSSIIYGNLITSITKYLSTGDSVDLDNVIWGTLQWSLTKSASVILSELSLYISSIISQSINKQIMEDAMNSLHNMNYNIVANYRTAELTHKILQNCASFGFFTANLYDRFIPLLFDMYNCKKKINQMGNKHLKSILLATLVSYFSFSTIYTIHRIKLRNKLSNDTAEYNGFVNEMITNTELIRFLNAQKSQSELLKKYNEQYDKSNSSVQLSLRKLNIMQKLILNCGTAAAILHSIISSNENSSIVKNIVSTVALINQLQLPLNHTGTMIRSFLNNWHNMTAMSKFLSASGLDQITRNRLNYTQGNSKIAIIGHIGAGKSTLVKLLLGLFQPTKGSITIDGQDIKSVNLHSLRQNAAYVQQNNIIINGTLRENLLIGNDKNLSDDEVYNIIDQLGLKDTLNPIGTLDIKLGMNGKILSEGERQIVNIIRVILRDPKLIIFDEPTSRVDMYTKNIIKKCIQSLSNKKTIIIISHDLDLIDDVDEIIVLDNGNIVERGLPKTLNESKGIYWKLKNLDVYKDIEAECDNNNIALNLASCSCN